MKLKRLQLRELTANNNKRLLQIMSDKEVKRFISLEHLFGPINSNYVKQIHKHFMQTNKIISNIYSGNKKGLRDKAFFN